MEQKSVNGYISYRYIGMSFIYKQGAQLFKVINNSYIDNVNHI